MLIEVNKKYRKKKVSYNWLKDQYKEYSNHHVAKMGEYVLLDGEKYLWRENMYGGAYATEKGKKLSEGLLQRGYKYDDKVIVCYTEKNTLTVEELLNYLGNNNIPLTAELYFNDSEWGERPVDEFFTYEDNKLII